MQMSTRILFITPEIQSPLQNPSKIEQVFFEDIIQENLPQYLGQQC